MSATSEYHEPTARQDYGPTTSSENVYEHVLDHKLTDEMSVPSIRTPILRAVPISSTLGDPEPDSTNPESILSVHNNPDKEVEYHIAEKSYDAEMPVDTLTGIVRLDEAVDTVAHISYPVMQETDDANNDNYVENATLIQAPINTAIVQNVTKLPQNFTINVDASVGNITTIQNLSQDIAGNQTLWLPTILATSAPTDGKIDEDQQQAGMSQILITSESYVSDASQIGRKAIETGYINRPKSSKVQILSNIPIPKNSNYPQPYITHTKDLPSPVYAQNHVYKLSTNVVQTKHLNNSVLCSKPQKNQSLIGSTLSPTMVNNSPVKNVTYSRVSSKSTNLNKVNNGANLNAMVAASSGNTQCHILSRVVSGPNKMSVHSGRKSVNTFKASKNSSQAPNSQKNQSRAIKIIQQTGTVHKNEPKSWPVTSVATYKSYGVLDTNTTSKIIQKVGSPPPKTPTPMSLSKFPAKGERLVLQSPCGPVLISTAPISTSLPKGPQYVQSGTTNLRYAQTYDQLSSVSQVSANQQLTAQILQSLSQPKLMYPNTINHTLAPPQPIIEEIEMKPVNQKRIVFGDKTTLLTADDLVGTEERPNLPEELRRYSFQSLALVMLDHTYSLPAQKTAVAPPSPVRSPAPAPIPVIPAIPVIPPAPLTPLPPPAAYTPLPPPHDDDDAASVVSSIEGDRRPPEPGGSDTETAPEGEEEGKTRCICNYTHDDGYMICCDRCGEWQHVDCMGIDRNNIPDAYMCELCQPRAIDRRHARVIQMKKREELSALGASDSDSSAGLITGQKRKRLLTVTTYTNTSGACITTYNAGPPALPPVPQPSLTLPKRGPKRPKKAEVVRKGTKRKLAEKRVKRKKEMMLSRNKYNSSLSSQSHWQESYESAMTNHYSPELRAKMVKYSSKLGNTPNMATAMTAHLCTTVPHAGGKILIATKDLKDNTLVIELRGKYMLSTQHRPQQQNARTGSQKPGPFVFFYRLPKDNTQVCIDTRTYGNEARFVRRSCKPNAELQHCIVKGALHVYLVTIGIVQSNTEITIGHDNNGTKQPCACGNPKHCKLNGMNTMMPKKTQDYPLREKRSRNRCLSSSSPVSPPLAPLTPVKEQTPFVPVIKSEKKSPIKHEFQLHSPTKNAVVALNFEEPMKAEISEVKSEVDLIAKEEMKPEIDEPDFCTASETPATESPVDESSVEVKREEIIPEEPKVEEEKIPKVEEKEVSDEEKLVIEKREEPEEKIIKDEVKTEEDRPLTREQAAKVASHDRSSRSSRTTCANQDSLDDKTDDSQDKLPTPKEKDKKKMTREERKMEAIVKAFERMEKAEQRKQEVKERQKRRESDPHPHGNDKEDDDDHCGTKKRRRRKGRARTTSMCARRRLNSADSDLMTSGDDTPRSPPPISHTHHNTPHQHHDIGLSSACLLVEAAVGSVESAFKLPKTKKTMATEWIGRSPERTPSPYRSPYRSSLVTAPSLESLVKVASTIIGDLSGQEMEDDAAQTSPPRTPNRDRCRPPKKARRITRSTPPTEVVEVVPSVVPQHSAKKRWLRQAISEESDSPNAGLYESPPNEIITPLKKRRVARESLSCEQTTIVPCNEDMSPILTSEDSPIKDDGGTALRQCKVRNIIESLYGRDRTRSDSGQGSDDPCNVDPDLLGGRLPRHSEQIRRIIGVPTPERDDNPPDNNNLDDDKTVPMDIDTTMPQQKIESNENSEDKDPGSPGDKLNSSQSADTSGNSSPQRDDMDDIQKKIHSFHRENILMLKSRNKKPPKEKRKKVNLNFDLNMVDDQISIQLRTENSAKSPDVNGDIHEEMSNSVHDDKLLVSPEDIPLPPAESSPPPAAPENIPLPASPPSPPPDRIPLPAEPAPPALLAPAAIPLPAGPMRRPPAPMACLQPGEPYPSRYKAGLFSGIFMSQPYDAAADDGAPDMSVIKSAIDRTTSLETGLFDKDGISPADELKSVQEILTRVNNMDSNNSVLLSGVLKGATQPAATAPALAPSPVKPYGTRADPRLNPPQQEKPKPVRRKLSISEYRKRHKGSGVGEEGGAGACAESAEGGEGPEWSSSSSGAGSLSPQRLDAAAAAAATELEQRLHRDLHAKQLPKGVFDAQPTASERQRENLSSRLRREFGLALPDDDDARPPNVNLSPAPAPDAGARCDR